MSESNSGVDPQGNPPSFIPSGNRRRRATSPIAREVPSSTFDSGRQQPTSVPPSFAPSSARHTTSQPSEAVPSFAPTSASSSRTPRRASGTTRNASPMPSTVYPAESRSVNNTGGRPLSPRSAGTPRPIATAPSSNRYGTATTTHHPMRIVATILIAIIIALILASFSMWNWVNGQLNKESWLSSKANTSGTSWLLLGSDQRDGEEAKSITGFRTDTILVLTKPNSGANSLISIPRDSLVKVNGTYMKINAVAQSAGRQALVEQVETITGQKIDHVAQIRFNGLKDVVDALGGIELCYDTTVNDALSGLNWQAGCHTADGTTALAFSRMRYSDVKGDFGRAERQRQVIGAIAKKATSSATLTHPSRITKVAKAGLSAVTVDENTNPYTLAQMMLAFKAASSDQGISGSVYWTDPNYMLAGVGSSVLLDDAKNLELFSQLAAGSHDPGAVGTLAEQ